MEINTPTQSVNTQQKSQQPENALAEQLANAHKEIEDLKLQIQWLERSYE
ncbi:hypothetical protein [Thalassotalea agarivorans]|uniref:Uncharacterized protein n=1 Tax=Thalassotalea agarivorans TaxID=349064 RepID=A0A1I0B1H5_THASX|nr:hypothetical protein [Thalassotalea agarivorans]SET00504.1 hypothetical protein SAMN05660429_00891 [Thalassotalea agarivorans]